MGVKTNAQRDALPLGAFAYPEKRLFPITDQEDLDRAISLIDEVPVAAQVDVKRRIAAIAKSLGLKGVPAGWAAPALSGAFAGNGNGNGITGDGTPHGRALLTCIKGMAATELSAIDATTANPKYMAFLERLSGKVDQFLGDAGGTGNGSAGEFSVVNLAAEMEQARQGAVRYAEKRNRMKARTA